MVKRLPPVAFKDRETPGAIVLGGAHGSLAVARGLGRRGIPVGVLTHDHPIAGYSRYASFHLAWPGPEDPEACSWLRDFATRNGLQGWALFPGGDSELRLIAENSDALSEVFLLTSPSWETARWGLNKRLTHQHASAVGVDIPWSFHPERREDISEAEIPFPVILKPMVRAGRNAFTDAKAWMADDRATLLRRYDEASALVDRGEIGLQEFIPGGGEAQFSHAAVWADGEPVASLAARRLRQYPIDFGLTSTYVETTENADVEAAARRFLKPLGFSGMAEVEFKFDRRDGRYKLLDVNMRPWTWIGLGAAAGVDFPVIQWRVARGEPVEGGVGRSGVVWTHASRDAAAALRYIATGALSLATYRRSFRRPATFAAFAWDDIVPGIVDLPLVTARVLARRLADVRSKRSPASASASSKWPVRAIRSGLSRFSPRPRNVV
jgi:predicted ATP-grasp superfamily ATP-dependent carboligase